MEFLRDSWPLLAQAEATETLVGSHAWDGGGYTGLLLLLLTMIGLLAGMVFFLKRFGLPKMKGGGKLELLETRPLGGRQFIVVGKYDKERFLLGVCPGRIDFLCRLEDADIDAQTLMKEFGGGEKDDKTSL